MRNRTLALAWRIARFVVAAALIGWLAWTAGLGTLDASALNWGWVALGLALVPFSMLLRALNFGLLLNREERLLGPWPLYRLTLIGAALGLVLPAGASDLVKARYGLVVHGHAEEMVVATVVDKLTSLTAVAALGAVAAWLTGDTPLALAALALTIGTALPLFLRWDAAWHLLVRVLAKGQDIDAEVVMMHARPPVWLLARVYAVSLAGWFVTYAIVCAGAFAVHAGVAVSTVFAIAPIATLTKLIPVSAGGLGLGELTMTALLARAGVAKDVAAQVALLQMLLLTLLPGAAGALIMAMGRPRR